MCVLMNTTKTPDTTKTANADSDVVTEGFQNRRFRAEIARTPAGGVRIHLRATSKRLAADHRQLAAAIYQLAAELERQSSDLGARWAISPEARNACIDIELGDDESAEVATRFAADVVAYLLA
jgi:hypothetical protein